MATKQIEPGFSRDVLIGYTMRGDAPLPVRVTFDDGRLWRVHVGTSYVNVTGAFHAYSVALTWVHGESLVFSPVVGTRAPVQP